MPCASRSRSSGRNRRPTVVQAIGNPTVSRPPKGFKAGCRVALRLTEAVAKVPQGTRGLRARRLRRAGTMGAMSAASLGMVSSGPTPSCVPCTLRRRISKWLMFAEPRRIAASRLRRVLIGYHRVPLMPRPMKGPKKSPILGRGLACLTAHEPSSTMTLGFQNP
jgi:hypothetical protein